MTDELPSRVAVLEAEIKHVNESLDKIAKDVGTMKSTMDQAKGGWRAFLAAAAVAGAAGALLAKLLAWLPAVPK